MAKRSFSVAGVNFKNDDGSSRQGYIAGLQIGQPATLKHDEGNKHDPLAIAVMVHGRQIGFVPRKFRGEVGFNALLSAHDVRIERITGWDRNHGVVVSVEEPD